MNKVFAFTVAAAFGLGGTVGALALLADDPREDVSVLSAPHPVWTEVQWPFLMDQWGKGKAFRCKPADCGTEVNIYLRAKIGYCNCTVGVTDDEELDRMSDLDLVGGAVWPLGAGRPIAIASMKGRSRAYTLTARHPARKTAISIVLNDRCDMVAATVTLPHDRPATIEHAVIEFLNSATVLRWAEVAMGI
jgi:hypothetical protein